MDAIQSQIIRFNGEPAGWFSLQPFCDVLGLLDDAKLREIPETRIVAECGAGSSEDDSLADSMVRYVQMVQLNCKRQIGASDFDQLNERLANVGRRRARGVMMAQKEMEDSLNADLKVVWDELKEAYSGADKVPMSMIGYVGSVIPSADIAMLDLTTEDAVFELGMPMKMTEAQLDALATRAKAQWSVLSGSAADYTADTVGTLGQIICGMAPADVESIPAARFKEAMTVLSEVYWCKQAVAEKLADKAVAIYGEPSTWGMSEVAGVGAVIGGLEAIEAEKHQGRSRCED
ncbi:uncharacterized protein LOC119114024 [Pollicipes pollicipes]|uniref:uncharacterized protein LOC119114024 n=1 Tax=Pollicipes pollicipes TaxID=41117 RepID=UPI00188552E0|nr:uncharacterized protein LOC119114024 [Pollicipes pollicipes]